MEKEEKNGKVPKRKTTLRCKNIVQALFVRILLALHSLLTTWRAADVMDNDVYYLVGLGNLLLLGEAIYTLYKRKGREGKWFCPCFLIYLCSTLPSIWFLEIDRLDRYDLTLTNANITSVREETLSAIKGISLPIALEPDTWIQIMEQSMMFLLIIGRWFLPRGELTRNELSQLLFVYLGTGSDILELFIVFEESEVRKNRMLSYVVLIIWSFSLLQFTFVITATKGSRRPRVFLMDVERTKSDRNSILRNDHCIKTMFKTEVWGLLLSTIIIDVPFLSLRLYILIVLNILSYGIMFFACKNLIMILVVIYRIAIIVCCFEKSEREQEFYGGNKHDSYEVGLRKYKRELSDIGDDKLYTKQKRLSSDSQRNWFDNPGYKLDVREVKMKETEKSQTLPK